MVNGNGSFGVAFFNIGQRIFIFNFKFILSNLTF
jgi:hypothetical protein